MPDCADVCTAARAWLDTPFHHQGRLLGVGCDCVGLVVGVARALGVDVVDRSGYARIPQSGQLKAALDAQLVPVPDLAPGCVVLMRFGDDPQHVGIVAQALAGHLSLIHAYAPARRVVEHRLDEDWRARIVQIYEYPAP